MTTSATPKRLADFISTPNNAGLIVMTAATLAILGLPVMWVAGVVVSYYLLEKAYSECCIIFIAALLPSVIAYYMMDSGFSLQVMIQIGLFLIVLSTLSFVLRTTQSWSIVIQAMGLIGAGFVLVVYWLYPNIDAMWLAHLKAFFTSAELADNQDELARYAQYATGMQAAILSCSAAFNLLIARYWQACVYRKKAQVRKECLSMHLSYISLVLMVMLGLCMLLGLNWALDAFIVALLPAFFVGCALLHSFTEKNYKKKNRGFVLTAFYVCNLIIFPILPLLVVITGIIDTLFPIRQNFGLTHK